MIALTSLLCLVTGATLAGLSVRHAAHAAVLERWGGALLVLGLLLLGAALPTLR
ncbi:hypothetical protein [Methylobacterium sp. A54F]